MQWGIAFAGHVTISPIALPVYMVLAEWWARQSEISWNIWHRYCPIASPLPCGVGYQQAQPSLGINILTFSFHALRGMKLGTLRVQWQMTQSV